MSDTISTAPTGAAAPEAVQAPASPAFPAHVVSPTEPAPLPKADPFLMTDEQLAARYVSPEASDNPPSAPVPPPVAKPDERTESAGDPPAEVAPPDAPTEPAPLATSFAVFDGKGELEIPRDLEISFKAGGKDLKLPLDRVVRMAQSAPQAEQYRQAAERLPEIEQRATQHEQQAQTLQHELQQNNALYERMLADPEFYIQAAQAYAAQHTPEARATRAEQESARLRQQFEQQTQTQTMQRQSAEAATYAAQRIAPAIDAIATSHPSVTSEEITDRFYRLTAPHLAARPDGNGTWVPPDRLPEVERLVREDMAQWAASLQQSRSAAQAQVDATTKAQVVRAQTDAQMAKRTLARAAAPALSVPSADTPKPRQIKSSSDAVEAAMDKVRAQIGAAKG